MWVAYMGLNKAYPKDPSPPSQIDQVVDSTTGCEALWFLDAYFGYHQIAMNPSDQLATSFITPFGAFFYTSMPFALWNADRPVEACRKVETASVVLSIPQFNRTGVILRKLAVCF